MNRLLVIALRNLLRNKWRSAISAVVVFVGVALVVFLQGFINGFLKNAIEDATLAKIGALQIHKRGYLDAERDQLKLDLPHDPAFAARVGAVPGVRAVAGRLAFEGMLGNGSTSSMYMATAIDPVAEYLVCPKRREQVAGGSTPLGPADTTGILVGQALLDSLDAKSGSTLTMLSASQRGPQNALDVQIHGVLPSRLMFESKRLATVPLAFAQGLLKMEGRVTEYAVAVDDLERVDEVADRLRATLGPEYEVQTWMELSQVVRDMLLRMRIVMVIISLILAALVFSGIFNTMLMSVSERIREIGTMLAVGVRRYQVLSLFLIEAAALGALGATLGAAVGLAIVRRMGASGITFHAPGNITLTFYPRIGLGFVGLAIGLAVLATIFAAIYPALRGARMRPVDALRSN